MKRFIKIFALLMVSLLVLFSGVNVALDHLSRATMQNSYSYYNEKGELVMAYNGDLRAFWNGRTFSPGYIHRVKADASTLTPVSPS